MKVKLSPKDLKAIEIKDHSLGITARAKTSHWMFILTINISQALIKTLMFYLKIRNRQKTLPEETSIIKLNKL